MSFFNEPFEKQVQKVIEGDLALLQMFIGIRNPIGLLQYYSSFIIAKINIMNAVLYGKHKVQARSLLWYRNGVTTVRSHNQALSSISNDSSSFYSQLVLDCSEDIKNELLGHLFLPLTDKVNKTYESLSNTDYMYSSNPDQSLINYVRNSEVSMLCMMDKNQVIAMYNTCVKSSVNDVKKILQRKGNFFKVKKKINEKLENLEKKIIKQEEEIASYKSALVRVKDRSFLRLWYDALVERVKNDAEQKSDRQIFTEDDITEIEKLHNKFIIEIVSRLLKGIIDNKEQHDHLLQIIRDKTTRHLADNSRLDYTSFAKEVKDVFKEKIDECDDQSMEIYKLVIKEIKADKVMKAEQSVLDDMLFEAVKQKRVDSALLLVCNGANIELEREGIKVVEILGNELKKPGFLVIRELYNDMPKIKASLHNNLGAQTFNKFIVEGSSYQEFKIEDKEFKIEDIFTLTEMRDVLPDGIVARRAADRLSEWDNTDVRGQIVEKEEDLRKLDEEFYNKINRYKNPLFIVSALLPLVIFAPFAVPAIGVPATVCCTMSYIFCHLSYAFHSIGTLCNIRQNAKNELEIAQEDLHKAIQIFEYFLECLQCSVVAGRDVFAKRCDKIKLEIDKISKSKEKWVNLANLFKEFECALNEKENAFNTKAIEFEDLARGIIDNRKRYMDELGQPDHLETINKTSVVIAGQSIASQNNEEDKKGTTTEIIEVKQDTEKKDVELMKERKARQEAEKARQEAKQEAERISQEAKQEAERIRQEAKQEAERISQEKDAYKNLLLKIQKGELPISALDNIDIESFASLIAGPSSSFASRK